MLYLYLLKITNPTEVDCIRFVVAGRNEHF
jgi:hypothetical protein